MNYSRTDALHMIFKMIASGDIPKEVYNKYLSNTKIGFMSEAELNNYFSGLLINPKTIMYEPNIELDEIVEEI